SVPGAIISSAFINPGSGLTSFSKSSPDRRATVLHSRTFSLSLAGSPHPCFGVCERNLGLRQRPRPNQGARRLRSARGGAPALGRQRRPRGLPQRGALAALPATLHRGDHTAQAVL